MRRRTRGRELALKYLFSRETGGRWGEDDFERFGADQERDADARAFARELIDGICPMRQELMSLIESTARNWSWRRMPAVDRAILLIGTYELLARPDIPPTVTINELVELAKKYSTAASGGFVNGVLDSINKSHCAREGKE